MQHLTIWAEDEKDQDRRNWAIARIEEVLNDPSVNVRSRAITGLSYLGHPRALEVAERVYMDEKEHSLVRRKAIHAIGRFKARMHIPSLRAIAREHQDTELRIAAIAELGNFKDQQSQPVFEAAASQRTHPRLRKAGQVALRKLQALTTLD